MSVLNFLNRPLKVLIDSRLFICRYQSQRLLDLLNKKAAIENEYNDELETLPLGNTIEWNKKLKSYRMRNQEKNALKLFEVGIRKHQFQPDYITYISMLEICKDIKDVDSGQYIHRIINKSSVRDNSRLQLVLMEMYMKCGDVDGAREMFDSLKHRTVVEYNAVMTAYNTHQNPQGAIDLFYEMQQTDKTKPNNVSFMLFFQACIKLQLFEKGKALHEELKQKTSNYIKNKELSNQIVAMYIASGDYSIAEEYFNQIKEPSVANYVGLMKYYNQLKNWEQTIQLYDKMKLQRRSQPDVSIYLTVLTAIKEMKNIEAAKQVEQDLIKQNLWQNHAEIQNILGEILRNI
ncbi:unnamed protein product [Rotaria socialis]|uniref:Pentatricopeptide repeat-containing protein n=1 Tax=Rotaria socialis TaxID=392032 RepID=A0A819VKG9_9BILA|nr:unnamed protein product [Rotaria socialis]CAF3186858.1 unnamed protein product [Rotaria socialis]CAF3301924.1 unnamed protein product [Rotaria socialis]CAF3570515.1 unnamed protein product [Rotaria socialis]CAF3677612.1 unnamed protein product [Rotaria socialis]